MKIDAHHVLDVLIEQGMISSDQLRVATLEQTRHEHKPLIQVIEELGFVSESVIRDVINESSEQAPLTDIRPCDRALSMVPQEVAYQHEVVPVGYDDQTNTLTVAITDTLNLPAIDQVRAHAGRGVRVQPVFANKGELLAALDSLYGNEETVDDLLQEIETREDVDFGGQEQSQPMIRLVNALLTDAVRHEASDIHFEPEQHFLRIRYRVDGVLSQIRVLHKHYLSPIVVRLKVMSGMNIAENRAPQDGQTSLKVAGQNIDFRVAVQPTLHGENVVLRILNKEKGIVPLNQLTSDSHVEKLKLLMARPEGVVIVTGPTGSGKTTTLYSILSELATEEVNIMTLEDPVEYPLPLVRQTSVNRAVKLDFSTGIRSIMRQDPDIILVGEVRDEDTAQMTLRAAMTGHQVYTTLHTNSALGAIPRLQNIGVLSSILAGNIIGIIGQRLVRTLCTHCKEPAFLTAEQADALGVEENTTVFQATGCAQCAGLGFKGRVALFEVLRITPELDELIAQESPLSMLKQQAVSQGFTTLFDEGRDKILQGVTTFEEVARVVDMTQKADHA